MFIDPNSAPSWNSTPKSLRTSYRSRSPSRGRSRSPIQIDPRSGLSSPTSVLRNTDLPVPDGPSSTEISPAGRVRETSSQITWRPKDLVRPSTTISMPTYGLPGRAPTTAPATASAQPWPLVALHDTGIRRWSLLRTGGIVPDESDGTFRQTSIEATKATTGGGTLTRADQVDASQ